MTNTRKPNGVSTGTRILNTVSLVVVGCAFLMIGAFLFLLLYPFETTDVYSFRVLGAPLHRGDVVTTEIHFTKHNEYDITATRDITCDDGNLVTLTPLVANLPKGEHMLVVDALPALPDKTSIGMCQLNIHISYHINHMREVHSTFSTEPFQVVEVE